MENEIYNSSNLKIALLQIAPTDSTENNLQKGIEYCRQAKSQGADIALFPEMWSCGYTIPENIEELKNLAVSADGDFVSAFGTLAKELNMAIGITFLEKFEPLPRNTLCIFDRFGNRVLTYAKVHTCVFGDEVRLTAGNEFITADLNTEKGNVRIGSMICYDREFPESARILMLKGAEIILVPNACPMEINRLTQLRSRAFENMIGIATCNYPDGKPDCNGHSTAFDGMAYGLNDEGSRDTLIIEADEKEQIVFADFDLSTIRKYRESEAWGNAYRRPEMYGLITSKEISPPFIRPDERKR